MQTNFKNKSKLLMVIILTALMLTAAVLAGITSLHSPKSAIALKSAGILETSAEDSPIWDGVTATSFALGSGTQNAPYQISTGGELALLAQIVNANTSGYNTSSVYYVLTKNIILNDTSGLISWDTSAPLNSWTAIGTNGYPFRANFEGNHFKVIGVYINTSSSYQGLFGYMNGGSISNTNVEQNYIKGGEYTGGVLGVVYSNGSISGCYNTGNITGSSSSIGGVVGHLDDSSITNCYNTGNITGTNTYTGGVVGRTAGGSVTNCYNTGEITGGSSGVGGIAGYCSGRISNCYNTGSVNNISDGQYTGGIAGNISSNSVTNCYNTGAVSSASNYAGGIAGYAIGSSITNCYNTGQVTASGTNFNGGITGDGGTITNSYFLRDTGTGINATLPAANGKTAAQLAIKSTYVNWPFDSIWFMPLSSGYPRLYALHTHSYNSGNYTAPACDDGYTTYTCTECGSYYYEPDLNSALGHNYAWQVTADPTASSDGVLTGTCSRDKSHTAAVTLPALDDTDYTYSEKSAATCTATGEGRYTWNDTTYGTFYFDVTIDALGHSYGNWTVTADPTTAATGVLTGTCSRDSSHTTTVTLPALNDTDYTYSVTTAETCTATGAGRYTWKTIIYGTFYFDVTIAAHGHNYGNWTVTTAPATASTGVLTGTCSHDNSHTTTVTLPALNIADYTYSIVTAAACEATGTGRYTWNDTTYGTFYFDTAIAALGHDYGAWTVTTVPAISWAGVLTGTCSHDSSHTDTVTLPALNTTDYTYSVVTAETCTATGTGRYTWNDTTYGSFYFDTAIAAHGHDYGNWTVTANPTTAMEGVLTGVCSHSDSHTATAALPALNITDYAYAEINAPTTETTGIGRYTWNDTTYGIVAIDITLDMLGHTYNRQIVSGAALRTEATCTAAATYWYTCEDCELVSAELLFSYGDPLGHDYGNWTVTSDPTTSSAGVLTGTCSHDNSHTTTVTLPALNTADYTYSVVISATCEATGTGRYTWNDTAYGTFYFDVTIPATGHDYQADTPVPPTCTEQGYTTYTCSHCGDRYNDDFTVATGHDYGNWTVTSDPTTAAAGVLTGTCSHDNSHTTTVTLPALNDTDYIYSIESAADCESTGTGRYTWKTIIYDTFYFDVTIPATGHDYQAGTPVPSTCTEQGYTTYICSHCGDRYNDDFVPATGHDYQTGTPVPPTCTEQGYTTYTCSHCGDRYNDAFVPATGHDYGNRTVTADPTTALEGELTSVCSHDSSHTTAVTLPALNETDYTHSVVTAAACTATGTGRYTYNDTTYGNLYFDVTIDAPGHAHQAGTPVPPACIEQGYTTYTCLLCGDRYNDDFTAATGHTLTYCAAVAAIYKTAGNIEYWHCEICGKYFSDATGATEITQAQTVIAALQAAINIAESNGVSADFFDGYILDSALSTPVREGWEFGGWYKDAAFTTPITTITEADLDGNGNITIYAKWTPAENPKGGLGGGAIAGIVIGSVLFAALAGFAIFWFLIKKKNFSDLLAVFKKKV